jgi:hypothetical protein
MQLDRVTAVHRNGRAVVTLLGDAAAVVDEGRLDEASGFMLRAATEILIDLYGASKSSRERHPHPGGSTECLTDHPAATLVWDQPGHRLTLKVKLTLRNKVCAAVASGLTAHNFDKALAAAVIATNGEPPVGSE